jgi:hypothetical protein
MSSPVDASISPTTVPSGRTIQRISPAVSAGVAGAVS